MRLQADGSNPENWVETGGRPLGIDFDNSGNLIVADAFRGLLSIAEDGAITELATGADGVPIRYADDVDVATDGKIYFSDASTKFGAKEGEGTYQASLLDLMEHGGHGRLLVFDRAEGKAKTLLDELNFANGVAVGHDLCAGQRDGELPGDSLLAYWTKKRTSRTLYRGVASLPR